MRKILFIYLCLVSTFIFAQACTVGSYLPIQSGIVVSDSLSVLAFPTNIGLVAPRTNVILGGLLGGYNNYGLANYTLNADADGYIQSKVVTGNYTDNVILGFNASELNQLYTGYEVYLWTSGGTIYAAGTGNSPTSIGTIATTTYLRISRTGSTFKAQKSTDGTTFTNLFTYAYTSTAKHWIGTTVFSSARIYSPIGYNLTAYTGTEVGATNDTLIICDGNSLTTLYYPDTLAQLRGTTKTHVLNFGVAGQTTTQMIADATSQIDTICQSGKYNIVVAWEVGNDLLATGDVNAVYTRFAAYCNARRANGVKVIAVTCPPRENVNDSLLQAANALMLANYTSFCDKIVDTRSDSRLATISSTYWNVDNVHLNPTGCGIVARMVHAQILNL